MRALPTFALGGIVLVVVCMVVATVGRVLDWSPFALVLLGAWAGALAGVGATVFLYVTGEDDA